jgi:hypothetical protein
MPLNLFKAGRFKETRGDGVQKNSNEKATVTGQNLHLSAKWHVLSLTFEKVLLNHSTCDQA